MEIQADIDSLEMSDEEFTLLRDLIYEHSGIYFDAPRKYIVETRLASKVIDKGYGSFKDYYMALKYGSLAETEMHAIFTLLTTNETYFFREYHHFELLETFIIPELIQFKKDLNLRIWSAGCSSGEEPYGLAIMLLEMKKNGVLSDYNLEVVGLDISKRVLEIARKGIYGRTSFRETSADKMKYFEQVEKNTWKVNEEVSKIVKFKEQNLLKLEEIVEQEHGVDIVLCRNAIIYFHDDAKQKLVNNFYDVLGDGGILVLGRSDSLMTIPDRFRHFEWNNDIIYRKPGE